MFTRLSDVFYLKKAVKRSRNVVCKNSAGRFVNVLCEVCFPGVKVMSLKTKSNNGIPNGASFDTAVTIELRFALLNVKCFSDFLLPLPACTIYCLHALPIDFMWHRLFMDMLGNGGLGALSKSNRIAMFLLSYTKRTQSFAYIFTRARFAFHRVHGAGDRICWKSDLPSI